MFKAMPGVAGNGMPAGHPVEIRHATTVVTHGTMETN
jgi:hypothetical protein